MTLPYLKKQLDRAKETQVPLFKLDLDYRHVKKAPLGMISRTGLLTVKTAEAIMKLIDEDPASKSDEQLAASKDDPGLAIGGERRRVHK